MTPYELQTTRHFLRAAAKFFRKHPELRAGFARVIDRLQRDPLEPGLRTHQLGGKLGGIYALSLTYEYRILFQLDGVEHRVTLLDVCSHDEVYG